MFCEYCGTRVEDDQLFCPNCGKRMGSAAAQSTPANPDFSAPVAPRPARAASYSGGLLNKFNEMTGLEKIFYPIVGGLLLVCFILSMLKVYKASGSSFGMGLGPTWLYTLSTIYFTLSITFFLMDYFDKFSFKWLRFFIAGGALVLFLAFVIVWIAGVDLMGYVVNPRLTVGGWFYFLFQLGLTGCSIMLVVLQMKK